MYNKFRACVRRRYAWKSWCSLLRLLFIVFFFFEWNMAFCNFIFDHGQKVVYISRKEYAIPCHKTINSEIHVRRFMSILSWVNFFRLAYYLFSACWALFLDTVVSVWLLFSVIIQIASEQVAVTFLPHVPFVLRELTA